MAVLGFHCCASFSLVVESGGHSLVAVCGLLAVDRGAWPATIHGIAESGTAELPTRAHTMCWLLLRWSAGSRVPRLQQLQRVGSRAQAQQLWYMGCAPSQHGGSPWTRD